MIEMDSALIREMINSGERISQRPFDKFREVFLETNVVSSAEGSARVKIGDTEVIAGVKLEIGVPFPDTPNEGVLIVNTEFVPLASEEFESGPPGEASIEVARVTDRVIRESKSIDVEKLVVKEKEKVWMIMVDIDVINADGNLIDAATLASTAALLNTKMPDLDEDDKPITDKRGKKSLPMEQMPLNTTFVKIGNTIMVDPDRLEEKAMDARLTIGTIDGKICSLQKGGGGGFTTEEISSILDMAMKKGDELRKMLK